MGNKRNAAITFDSELYNSRFDPTWNRHVLYSLAEWINGMAFRNINFTSNGKPVIKIAEIKNGISGQTKFTQADYDSIYRVTDGDMLFSWSGQPDTSIDVFRWRGPDGWLNQHIFKVHPKDRCLEAYFFYLLKYLNPNFVRIARNKQTTGLGHVTKRDLQNMKVGLPSEDDQRAIAHILGSLDDKIELNRQINRTLEAMSQAIFKSWFVDFEPVRAKAEGRDPGLPKDIADLFPDRL
jgi:type I restriction enzyme S subunit